MKPLLRCVLEQEEALLLWTEPPSEKLYLSYLVVPSSLESTLLRFECVDKVERKGLLLCSMMFSALFYRRDKYRISDERISASTE